MCSLQEHIEREIRAREAEPQTVDSEEINRNRIDHQGPSEGLFHARKGQT